jgi:hypothetical protein
VKPVAHVDCRSVLTYEADVPVKLLLIILAHSFIVAEIHEGRFRSEAPREQVLTRL